MTVSMSVWEYIISMNIFPVVALVALILFIAQNSTFNKHQSHLFIIAAATNLLTMAIISLDFLIMRRAINFEGAFVLRRITSFLNFALSPTIGFFLLLVTAKERLKLTYYIPLAVNTIVCFISIFIPLVFFISPNNGYSRGILFFLPILTSIVYVSLLLLTSLGKNSQTRRAEFVFICAVIVLLILGMIMEVVFAFYFITWSFSAINLSLYYLQLNINRLIIDPLTQVFNRVMFEKKTKALKVDEAYGYAILDINDFKTINDTLGHDAGDKCLQDYGRLLNKCLNSCASVYRIGGDEFACLFKAQNLQRFNRAIDNLRIECKLIKIEFACGYACSSEGATMDDVFKEADNNMYQEKNKMKS